jgi:hypothetical protein
MRTHTLARLAMICIALAACSSEPTATSVGSGRLVGAPVAYVSPDDCGDCVFGPTTYTRAPGPPITVTETFAAIAGDKYIVDIDDLGSQGADGSVQLNGVTLMANRVLGEVGPRHVVVEVTLAASNDLEVRLGGKKGSQLQVSVRPRPACYPALPDPVLVLGAIEHRVIGGVPRVEYHLSVSNFASFPDALFAPAPWLPPCGLNTNASRTWVEIFANNVRVNGFCALSSAAGLNGLVFVTPDPAPTPPSSAFIQINDRECNLRYQSDPIALPVPVPGP